MDGELSTAMRVLITLTAVGIVIGIVIGIYFYLNTETDTANTKLEAANVSMANAQVRKYDLTTLTGVEVQAAIEMHINSGITIVVSKNINSVQKDFCYGTGLQRLDNRLSTPHISGETGEGLCNIQGGVGTYFGDNVRAMRDNATDAFVRNSQTFKSTLIQDSGNQVIGILFLATD